MITGTHIALSNRKTNKMSIFHTKITISIAQFTVIF
jgi:hypothetical protein